MTTITSATDNQAIVSHDATTLQSNRASSLNKLEQEISDLVAAQRNSQASHADTNVSNTTPKDLGTGTTNLGDGLDTSILEVPTTPEEITYRKRFIDSKNHYDKTTHEQRMKIQELEEKINNSQNPPQTAEELSALKAKNPEMFTAFESMVNSNKGVTESRVMELEKQLASTRQEKAVGEVLKSHGDFYDVVSSGEWGTWLGQQPAEIQQMVNGNTDDAVSLNRALDLYKFDKGVAQSSPQQNSNNVPNNTGTAADSISNQQSTNVNVDGTTNGRIWTRSEIARMSISDYERFASDILLAQSEGRIRNDKR